MYRSLCVRRKSLSPSHRNTRANETRRAAPTETPNERSRKRGSPGHPPPPVGREKAPGSCLANCGYGGKEKKRHRQHKRQSTAASIPRKLQLVAHLRTAELGALLSSRRHVQPGGQVNELPPPPIELQCRRAAVLVLLLSMCQGPSKFGDEALLEVVPVVGCSASQGEKLGLGRSRPVQLEPCVACRASALRVELHDLNLDCGLGIRRWP